MPIQLQGKPILITGASSGIGAHTAIFCARAQMPVLLMARRTDQLEHVAQAVRDAGGRAHIYTGDVADPQACAKAVEQCVDAYGSIYSVFANAGFGVERPVHTYNDSDLRHMFEVNFFGTLHTIRPALPHMLRARAGHILVCSSCLAKMSIPYFSVYSATKAAQNHVARAMNLELQGTGVHVSSVHPVGTRTEFFDTARKLSGPQAMVPHAGNRFMQPPQRVAAAIINCLRRPRPEVWTSFIVRFGMSVCTLFPAIADLTTRKMVRDYRALHPEDPLHQSSN